MLMLAPSDRLNEGVKSTELLDIKVNRKAAHGGRALPSLLSTPRSRDGAARAA